MFIIHPLVLGFLAILAGCSFALPNRMGVIYKLPIAVLCISMGILYAYMSVIPMTEAEKIPLVRTLLVAMVTTILCSNVGSYAVEKLRIRAIKKAGLHPSGRRKTDLR